MGVGRPSGEMGGGRGRGVCSGGGWRVEFVGGSIFSPYTADACWHERAPSAHRKTDGPKDIMGHIGADLAPHA